MENGNKPRVGKYILEKVLGRGAMGVVYLAKDPTIGRNVAVKCIYLPQGLEEDKVKEFRERFLREARSAGLMNHPNIVTIYEADEGSSATPPFIAMEYIEGETWNQKIKKGQKFAPDHLFPLLRDVASSLEYAHKANVIHRDIKPGNIIETREGRAKLMDFGIAKVPTSELTREGQFLGTPAYMSPEQVRGKAVDARSDLFSLGAVAYEMISGKKPFDGEELTTVLHKIVHDEPADIRDWEKDVRKEAWAIIKKLLRKDTGERYSNASELIADIDAYLAGALPPYAQDYVEKTVPPQDPKKPGEKKPVKDKPPKSMLIKGLEVFCVVAGILLVTAIAAALYLSHKDKTEGTGEPVIENSTENIVNSSSQEETQAPAQPAKSSTGAPAEMNTTAGQNAGPQAPAQKPKPTRPAPKKTPGQPSSQPDIPKAENPKVQPVSQARLALSFDLGGTKKGEANLAVDGKMTKTQKIEKGALKNNVWTDVLELTPGKHKIRVSLRTEIMGVQTSKEEEHEFTAGKETTLKIKIQKVTTKLIFSWSD